MRRHWLIALISVVAVTALVVAPSFADDRGGRRFGATLSGYEEVPAVSTTGSGALKLVLKDGFIEYELSYTGLEGAVAQAHIHFGQRSVNGGISAFLCTNLGNGPPGTPMCPPSPATVTGTIVAAGVVGPTGQGIDAGELDELVQAIRAGIAYGNVHSDMWPGGEIRGQIGPGVPN